MKQAIVLDWLPAIREITFVLQHQFPLFDESANSSLWFRCNWVNQRLSSRRTSKSSIATQWKFADGFFFTMESPVFAKGPAGEYCTELVKSCENISIEFIQSVKIQRIMKQLCVLLCFHLDMLLLHVKPLEQRHSLKWRKTLFVAVMQSSKYLNCWKTWGKTRNSLCLFWLS